MPLHLKFDSDVDIELAIWEISEDASYFYDKIQFHNNEMSIINNLSKRKLIEWLGSRYLLHLMSGRIDRGKFTKDIHGKPHLENSNFHISISHSKEHVAVIASKLLIGIDIQHYVSKIYRIKHKFVNNDEIVDIPENRYHEALHVIWGAKESLYKAYGKRSLDFKKNIIIRDLDLSQNQGKFYGKVIKDDYNKNFVIQFNLFEKFALVYAKECS